MNPLPPDARRALEPTAAELDAQLAPLTGEERRFAAMATAPTDAEVLALRARLPQAAPRRSRRAPALLVAIAAVLLLWWALPAPPTAPTPAAPDAAPSATGAAAIWPVGAARPLTDALALSPSIDIDPAPAARMRLLHQDAAGARVALIDGAATFEVDPNGGGRDLRVLAGEVEVRVTGTRFTVRRADDRVEVAVARGHVDVLHPGGATALGAGGSFVWPGGAAALPAPALGGAPAAPPTAAPAPAPVAPAASPDPNADPNAAQARGWAALLDRIDEVPPAEALAELDRWLRTAPPGPLTDTAEVHRLLLLAEAEPPRRALTDVERWLAVNPQSSSFPRVHLLRAELLVLDGRRAEAAASVAVVRASGSANLQDRAGAVADACAP